MAPLLHRAAITRCFPAMMWVCSEKVCYCDIIFSEHEHNAVARPSVVCNVRAPYSGGSNFRQYFYGIRHLGHPLTFTESFTEIVLGD